MSGERRIDPGALEASEFARKNGRVAMAAELAGVGLGLRSAPLTSAEVAMIAKDPDQRLILASLARIQVDALKTVAEGVNSMRSCVTLSSAARAARIEGFSAIIVTHYARILDYITPDKVHVMIDGKIAERGGPEFARTLESEGYGKFERGKRIHLS